MQANETTLRKLVEGQIQFQVPLYQRRYAWEARQLKQLWSDIVGMAEGQVASHFLGAVVLAPSLKATPELSQWTVVDGQQRLTTLMIAMCAVRDHLAAESPSARERINELFLTNKFQQGDLFFKLLPTQSDRDAFKACVENDHGDLLTGQVGAAYQFFRNKLLQADKPDEEGAVARLEEIILDRLNLVQILVDKDDNTFRIFESINNTGMRLNQVDLIRNYVFMCLPNLGEHVYTKYWRPMQELLAEPKALDQLMFQVLVLRQGEKAKYNDVYRGHQELLESIAQDEAQVEAYVIDLARRAKHLAVILDPPAHEDPRVIDHLTFLSEWEAQTTYPVIMRLLELREDGDATTEDLVESLRYLESFLVRRMIASVPTNNLNRIFMRLAPLLDRDENPAVTIRSELSTQQRYWASDDELREAVRSKPFYIAGRGQQKKLVLRRLEEAFGSKEKVDLGSTSIEHVLPQHLTESWRQQLAADGPDVRETHATLVHTLGNLTLTGYNSELGDLPFDKKRERLLQTSIALTKSITAHTKWGSTEILNRADLLATKAITIWPAPLAQPEDNNSGMDWTLLHDAVALLVPGTWSSYSDLAQLVGTSPVNVGAYLVSTGMHGAHRVLTSGGQPSSGFHWHDPAETRDVRDVLRSEGLTFNENGQADPTCRMTAAELAQRLDLPGSEDFLEADPVHIDPSDLEPHELRFHKQLASRSGPLAAGAVTKIIDHWRAQGAGDLQFGTAPTTGRCTPTITKNGTKYWLFNIYPDHIDVTFNTLSKRAPFDDIELREEIRHRLNDAPGIDLPASKLSLSPSFPCAALTDASTWDVVVATLDWFAHRVSLIT